MSDVAILVSDEGLGGIVPFGQTLRTANFSPLLFTGRVDQNRLENWRNTYDEVHVLEDPYDAGALVAAARDVAGDRQVAALFSCYDGLVLPAARAAAELRVPHPAISGLIRCRNKYAMRLQTRRAALATPRFALLRSPQDCETASARVGLPAVIKPLNGLASHLVRKVNDLRELQIAYAELATRIGQSFAGNYSRPLPMDNGSQPIDPRTTFLLEQFLSAAEYSAELLIRNGKFHRVALFHKFIVDDRGFLECGFTMPALGVSGEREEMIWQHIETAIQTLELDNAAAHVEVLDTDRGPMLVEVNAGRAGGQILVRAVRKATGVDLLSEIVALQCGRERPMKEEPTLTGRVTTLTVFPSRSGRLESIEGLEAVRDLPGVIEVITFCNPGDVIDVEDKELFAVNLLVARIEGEELLKLYHRAREFVRFVIV
jgi:biotin carboxylase